MSVGPSNNSRTAVVVLAAGKGKRMRSDYPKVLHRVCGRPLVGYVLGEVRRLDAGDVVLVVGRGAEQVTSEVGGEARPVEQEEQLGTGHAVMVALDEIGRDYDEILVLPGDSPLIRAETLQAVLDARRDLGAAAAVLTVEMGDPSGYGRVVRDPEGRVAAVVEDADADDQQRRIREVNACTYAFDRALLEESIESLDTENAQGEYYLTALVEDLVSDGYGVVPVEGPEEEAMGVNDHAQLARAEAVMRRRINHQIMSIGVNMVDPERTYIDHGVSVGAGTVVMPFVFMHGETRIGAGSRIGPFSVIRDSVVGEGCVVESSWLEGSNLASGVTVGPCSRLRPGCSIGAGAKVGSLHLSYMGDVEIGEDVNVGAGSITCNYDGKEKHRTVIRDRSFIGSDTMLVAPVTVGEGSITGAGSAIYEDVPDGSLGIERNEQKNIPGWSDRKEDERKGEAED